MGEPAAGLDFSSGEQELGEFNLFNLPAEPWAFPALLPAHRRKQQDWRELRRTKWPGRTSWI